VGNFRPERMVTARRQSREPRKPQKARPAQRTPPSGSDARRRQSNSDRRLNTTAGEWLTGLHAVREALRARRRRLDLLLVREGRPRDEVADLVELAGQAGVPVEAVAVEELDRRLESDENHQGVALRAGFLPELSLSELLELATQREGGRRILALDGVEDPQNVGAIARVAESAGVVGMILTDRRAPALTPSVARASAGAIEWLPVARVSNLGRALSDLQSNDYWILAAALGKQARALYEMEDRLLTGNLVLVLGAEGRGVRPSILDQVDHRVQIPMKGRVASLNVSTAGAVLLYDLLRRSVLVDDKPDPGDR